MDTTLSIEVRPTEPHEYRATSNVKAAALLQQLSTPERFADQLPTWEITSSMSAWDGDRCVGHASQFLIETTVPGGERLPTGGITRVGVLPTHRRLGLARRLMGALIDDALDRQLAMLSLRTSETMIYGRFGFGVAGDFATAEINARAARPQADDPDIEASVAAISSAYLGGRSWHDLVAVGEASAHPDAAERADDLFITGRQPVCGSFF